MEQKYKMNKMIVLVYAIFLFLFFIKNCSAFYEIINLNTKIIQYIKKHNSNLKEKQYKLIAKTIIKQSLYYKIPWNLTLSIMKEESNFDPNAISSVGAKGLMQVYTLECCEIKADKTKLFEIEYNIAFGLCIFKDKLKITNNDKIKAITLYNGSGPDARKYTLKVLNTLNRINNEFY